MLVIDDNSPDGTGAIADSLAAELPFVVGAAPAAQGRPRACLSRRLPAGARRRRRARGRDGLRLLARPGRRAAPDRGRRGRRRHRDRLPVRGRRRRRQLGARAPDHLEGRILVRGPLPADGRQGSDGGFQVHAAVGARGDRPRRHHLEGICVPDRADVPCQAGRLLGGRAADHVRRPDDRDVEDEPPDRARGDLACPAAQVRGR